jgi:hypothetical protein
VAVVTISLTQFVGTGEKTACDTDRRTLQSAVVLFHTNAGYWPTTSGEVAGVGDPAESGDIAWHKSDGLDPEGFFDEDYIVEQPESNDECNWHINDAAQVVVPISAGDPPSGSDQCECCTVDDPPTWCLFAAP